MWGGTVIEWAGVSLLAVKVEAAAALWAWWMGRGRWGEGRERGAHEAYRVSKDAASWERASPPPPNLFPQLVTKTDSGCCDSQDQHDPPLYPLPEDLRVRQFCNSQVYIGLPCARTHHHFSSTPWLLFGSTTAYVDFAN